MAHVPNPTLASEVHVGLRLIESRQVPIRWPMERKLGKSVRSETLKRCVLVPKRIGALKVGLVVKSGVDVVSVANHVSVSVQHACRRTGD